MPSLKKGLLIAIEGIDGSGKSTLAHNLHTMLCTKQYSTILTKEPGDSLLGKKIREIVQTHSVPICPSAEFLLFAADRAQHFAELIIPALEQKQIIISDRLSDSSLAYQGYGRGLDLVHLTLINQWAMNNITPDLTIFVRIPVAIALKRITHRGAASTFEKETFLEKVAHGFESLYKTRAHVITVDGTESPEHLTTNTFNSIEQWIHKNTLLF